MNSVYNNERCHVTSFFHNSKGAQKRIPRLDRFEKKNKHKNPGNEPYPEIKSKPR